MTTSGQIIFNQRNDTENKPPPTVVNNNGNAHTLEEVVQRSHKVLMTLKSIFPFELFPDELIIDENKVTYICHEFGYERVHSVFIDNITYVTVDTSLIHASLHITDSTSERFPVVITIKHLNKEDALKARSLIEGLISAKKLNINFTNFEMAELTEKLIQLGKANPLNI